MNDLPFEMQSLNDLEYYSPEVVSRLGKSGLDLVWCTSWENKSLNELTENMDALKNGRKLPIRKSTLDISPISQKLEAIISDQTKSPSPFVWVDDYITHDELDKASMIFESTPHLILPTKKVIGLDRDQLLAIEAFSRTYGNCGSSATLAHN